jgi:hypothetical protein
MYFIHDDLDYIQIKFKKPFFNNFKEIYLSPNKDIIYYDNSHLNYIYTQKIDNIKYTFYGFYKDDFFVIIMNSFNEELNITIENKFIILLKLLWTLKKIDDSKSIYVIDKNKLIKYKTEAIILPLRNKFFNESNINIENQIKIIEYKKNYVNINIVTKIKHFDLKKQILSFFGY